MIIGIDYWNTISQNPPLFRDLARSLMAGGATVYIVTAVGANRSRTVRRDIDRLKIPNHGIVVCKFKDPLEAPKLKYDACIKRGISMFIDDRKDTCQYLFERGIIALNILRNNKNYDLGGAHHVNPHVYLREQLTCMRLNA